MKNQFYFLLFAGLHFLLSGTLAQTGEVPASDKLSQLEPESINITPFEDVLISGSHGDADIVLGWWKPLPGDFKTEVSFVDMQSDGHSLHISERKEMGHTVRQRIQLEQGQTYDFSIWVKSGDQSFTGSLTLMMAYERRNEEIILDAERVTGERWIRLQGTFTYQPERIPENIYIYIRAEHPDTDFYMDDFRINLVG